jgi:sugar phosphate isomerase/epimerase
MLGHYLDEIELLFFESLPPGSLPSEEVIAELVDLSHRFELAYNIHLPIDVFIGDHDPRRRQQAVDGYLSLIERTAPLGAWQRVLHLPYDGQTYHPADVKKWQDRTAAGLGKILEGGSDNRSLGIETLDYPFHWLDHIIFDFDLSVCLDIGHLILSGWDLKEMYQTYASRTPIIHVHGVAENHDHLALNRLSKKNCDNLMHILKKFTGTVSIEVFSFDHLLQSLRFLEACFMEGDV